MTAFFQSSYTAVYGQSSQDYQNGLATLPYPFSTVVEHDMLLSTTVGASYKFKRSMPTEIIALLTKTNLRRSALSHMSARAIQIAAQDGNRKAKLALRELPMQAKNML
tara:strand:+ start:887 stop:1210 length:324 start_codon:yes stop_codon:yes gene_type:complete